MAKVAIVAESQLTHAAVHHEWHPLLWFVGAMNAIALGLAVHTMAGDRWSFNGTYDTFVMFFVVANVALVGNLYSLAVAALVPAATRERLPQGFLYHWWGLVNSAGLVLAAIILMREPQAIASALATGHPFGYFYAMTVLVLAVAEVTRLRHAWRQWMKRLATHAG